ncbi:MAG TPA: ribonuclease R, partial [Polyangiaceae bacterium]|nr:ribonuclease R [Polyangiaceae bacterium]
MARGLPSRSEILECLADAGRPLHAGELASRCGVAQSSLPRLVSLLDDLAEKSLLRRVGGQRYAAGRPAAASAETWEGVLSLNPRGFGFVTAVGHEDVYIAPEAIGAALHGDRVTVSIVNRSNRGAEGRVDRVISRRNPRVAGVLRKRGKSIWLEPDDSRIRGPIVITSGGKEGREGAAAVVTITRFPESADENPEAELVSVLGVPGDPNVEVAKILIREQIEEQHPDGAIREGEAMAAKIQRTSLEGRRDLRQVPLPTIDPEDARDHDDAIWVEKRESGYRAYVGIADVSEYVQPGSELDAEAKARGCTIYLPDRAIPMLPAALAADLCSLLPEQERLTLAVIADLDADAVVERFEVVEGVMRSQAMLTYGGVARALGFTETPPRSAQAEAFKRDLKVLDELSRKLRRRRMARGALDLDLPEARVVIDPKTGAPLDVIRRAQDPGVKRAYAMVEELMLLANELVARFLGERKSPAIYRVHGRPTAEKLERLAGVAEKLGVDFDPAMLDEPGGISRWLSKIQKHPRRNVLEMLLLRSLKQATYDTANIGHFGLASDAYLHFTSPIRRYPDVEVHRAVKHLLRGGLARGSSHELQKLAESATHSSVRERAAMDVEREVVDLHRCLLMRDRVGETYEGTVSGVVGSGVYVSLDQPYVDVLVRFEGLGPDHYELGEDEISVSGLRSGDRIELGDRMVVTIEDVAVLRRSIYGRRVVPEAMLQKLDSGERRGARQRGAPSTRTPAERDARRRTKEQKRKQNLEQKKGV